MRIDKTALFAAMAISATTGIAVVSVASPGGEAPTLPPGASDGTPRDGTERIDARGREPGSGRELGVLVYRDRTGELCMAQGQTSGDRVGVHDDKGFRGMPLREGGICGLRLDPVAATVERTRTQTIVSGVAKPGVNRVEVAAGTARQATAPGASGGFLVTFDHEVVDTVRIAAHGPDGTETVAVPGPGRSLAEMSAEMKRNARKPDEPPPGG